MKDIYAYVHPYLLNDKHEYFIIFLSAACEEGPGLFSHFLTGLALLMVAAMLPFSLIFVVKVVQVSFWSREIIRNHEN